MSDTTGGTAVTGMASTVEVCGHCGNIHVTTCPRIRAIEYHADGTVKRIEFHGPEQETWRVVCGEMFRIRPGIGPDLPPNTWWEDDR